MGFALNRCWARRFKQLMTPTDEVFLEVGVCIFRNHPREDCPEGFFIVFAEVRQRISPRSGGLPGADLGPRRGEMPMRFSRPPRSHCGFDSHRGSPGSVMQTHSYVA